VSGTSLAEYLPKAANHLLVNCGNHKFDEFVHMPQICESCCKLLHFLSILASFSFYSDEKIKEENLFICTTSCTRILENCKRLKF